MYLRGHFSHFPSNLVIIFISSVVHVIHKFCHSLFVEPKVFCLDKCVVNYSPPTRQPKKLQHQGHLDQSLQFVHEYQPLIQCFFMTIQGWKSRKNSVFPAEKYLENLPVHHYFFLSPTVLDITTSQNRQNFSLSFGKYLPVHHYFYLSRTRGQSVISIPDIIDGNTHTL